MSAVLLKDFHLEQQENTEEEGRGKDEIQEVGDILEKEELAEVKKEELEGGRDERAPALWDLVRI